MSLTYRPHHPFPVPAFNWLLEAVGRLGPGKSGLDADRMMAAARFLTGLKDFGDPHFEEPFRLLLDDIGQDKDLTSAGLFFHWFFLSGFLRNRLRLVETWKKHPEILERPVAPPLVILGLPRTATTRLFNVLAAHPDFRTLTFWEAVRPVARPLAKFLPFNGRRINGWFMLTALDYLAPQFKAIHELRLDGPEECIHLFGNDFSSWLISVEYNAPGYTTWFLGADHRKAYQEFRAQLQTLQGGERRPWLLKSPHHIFAPETLLETFPGARIVQTHRDPAKVVPSCCSLARTTRGIAASEIDTGTLGEDICHQLETGLRRTVESRARLPRDQVLDVAFNDITQDIEGVVTRIFSHFNMPLEAETLSAMKSAMAEKTLNKYGKHTYAPEEFGLSREGLRERFSFYYDAFQIEPEG